MTDHRHELASINRIIDTVVEKIKAVDGAVISLERQVLNLTDRLTNLEKQYENLQDDVYRMHRSWGGELEHD